MTDPARPTAYPLQWPPGWPRTATRQAWPSDRTTLAGALKDCQDELRRLGARNIVLSSNVTLGAERPFDPGVVAYCTYDGLQIAIPCDRWTTVAGNLRAIAKTIDAMRGMERWGAKHMIRAMFTGFVALPAPGDDWRQIFGNPRTIEEVDAAYKALAKAAHPDQGGSHERMAALNAARQRAHAELGSTERPHG